MKRFNRALVVASTAGMSEADWLESRRKGLGGSDIGAVAGLSHWGTSLTVYIDKVDGISRKPGEPAYWGNVLEDVVAAEFAKRTGAKVRKVNLLLQHPTHTFMLANLDRIAIINGERYILECKTAGHFTSKSWDEEGIPASYEAQVRWYMAVTGIKKAYIAVLIAGQRFEMREIIHDQETEDHLIQIGADFWAMVEARTPPAMDGSGEADEWLQKKFADSTMTTITLEGGGEFLVNQYIAASEIIDQQEQIKAMARQNLERLMGENQTAIAGSRVITWKPQGSNRFDTKQFRKDHPKMAEVYTKTSEQRVFRVK